MGDWNAVSESNVVLPVQDYDQCRLHPLRRFQ